MAADSLRHGGSDTGLLGTTTLTVSSTTASDGGDELATTDDDSSKRQQDVGRSATYADSSPAHAGEREASLVADASTPSLPESAQAVDAVAGLIAESTSACLPDRWTDSEKDASKPATPPAALPACPSAPAEEENTSAHTVPGYQTTTPDSEGIGGNALKALPPVPPGWVEQQDPSGPQPPARSQDEWTAQWERLKTEASALHEQCEGQNLTRATASTGPFHSDLRAHCAEIPRHRAAWEAGLFGDLGQVRKRVLALRESARRLEGELRFPKAAAQGLKRDLDAFKAKQRYDFETLAAEELKLMPALEAAAALHETWLADGMPNQVQGGGSSGSRSRPARSASPRRVPPASVSPQPPKVLVKNGTQDAELTTIAAELEALDAESEKAGGATGGWTVANHEAFVRMLRIFRMQVCDRFYECMEERLKDVPRSWVETHVAWHAEHEARQAKRRVLLERLRQRRVELEEAEEVLQDAPSPGDTKANDPVLVNIRGELQAIEAEIEKAGGRTGKWTVVSHDVFMRVLRMHKMKVCPKFFQHLEERLPDMSRQAVEAHVQWHVEDELKQARRRLLLERWRQRRAELDKQAEALQEQQQAQSTELHKRAASSRQRERKKLRQEILEWRERRAEEEERALAEQQALQAAQRRPVYEDPEEVKQRLAKRSMDMLKRKLQAHEEQTRSAGNLPSAAGLQRHSKAYDFVESRLHATTKCYTEMVKAIADNMAPPSTNALPLPPRSAVTFVRRERKVAGQRPNSGRRSASLDFTAQEEHTRSAGNLLSAGLQQHSKADDFVESRLHATANGDAENAQQAFTQSDGTAPSTNTPPLPPRNAATFGPKERKGAGKRPNSGRRSTSLDLTAGRAAAPRFSSPPGRYLAPE